MIEIGDKNTLREIWSGLSDRKEGPRCDRFPANYIIAGSIDLSPPRSCNRCVAVLRVAKRRYSFYFDAKHDFHEKHRKGKRRIKRGEYIYIYIEIANRAVSKRPRSSKEKKNWRKNMLAIRQARKRPLARWSIVFLRKGNIFSKIVLRHTKLSYSIEIMLPDFIVLRER